MDISTYQYTPLNNDVKEIRLLTLHEGTFEADIKTSLHTASLNPDHPSTYEALSYVWGSPETPIQIQVGLQTLAVTKNLAEALRYIRYKDKRRVLWIDAICVDQKNLKERSSQVKRMADLYRLAERVVVWLGPEKEDSGYGLSLLEELSSKVTVDWTHSTVGPRSNETATHWSNPYGELSYGDKELHAIYLVISCSWFERLWIWQEIHCAKSSAIMMCGFDTIPWMSFRTALFCLASKASWPNNYTSVIFKPFRARVSDLYTLLNSERRVNLIDAMWMTRYCKYTDPKDRVYAIQSLLNSTDEAICIEPDYEQSTSQVYQDVTLRYISHRKDINILMSSGREDERSDLPSWVPDWTIAKKSHARGISLAGGYSQSKEEYRGAGVLSVTGILAATVQNAKRIVEFRNAVDVIAEIKRLAPHDVLREPYIGGGSFFTAYCNTLCANKFSDKYVLQWILPTFQQGLEALSAILHAEKPEILDLGPNSGIEKVLGAVWTNCQERSFVKTEEGYIGIMPRNTLVGDLVCVLLGCQMPMLLRPTINSQYRVVGPCYVDGLMNGEAFLGRLPDHYQTMYIFDEMLSGHTDAFLDRRTDRLQYNDPRLESDQEDIIQAPFSASNPGDLSSLRRITPEMIERRGVKLQTFDLI